jgi:hypothetical protein
MTLQTEYILQNKGVRADPACKAFAKFFTQHYDEIAEKYPIYRELFEYAKYVSLAKYLKKKGIPLLWFLLTNKDLVITEDSPGTVDALAKRSEYWEYITIEGGVDLACKPPSFNYVLDKEAAQAIKEAIELYGESIAKAPSIAPSDAIVFETEDKDLTITPSQTFTISHSSATGDRYQTDIALWYGKEPGLEVARYYAPEQEGLASFGKGWHLMIPYQVKPYGDRMIEFLNAIIPEKMVVKNLLTGREEVLTFSKDRYSIAGYVPEELERSNLIGLFLLSDGSFRLADKLGNEFQFDQEGYLTEMIFSPQYCFKFEYGYEKREGFTTTPYRIEPVGDEYITYQYIMLPKTMKLVTTASGEEEVFVFNEDNKYGVVGYTPVDGKESRYTILALMTDGSFVLGDKYEGEMSFDPAGRCIKITAKVVKEVSQRDYRVRFDYEFVDGQLRVEKAHVMKKDQTTTLYALKYEYGRYGRLCKVITPTGEMKVEYDEEKVMLARR